MNSIFQTLAAQNVKVCFLNDLPFVASHINLCLLALLKVTMLASWMGKSTFESSVHLTLPSAHYWRFKPQVLLFLLQVHSHVIWNCTCQEYLFWPLKLFVQALNYRVLFLLMRQDQAAFPDRGILIVFGVVFGHLKVLAVLCRCQRFFSFDRLLV